MTDALRNLYLQAGVYADAGPVAAHEHCSCAKHCWKVEPPERVPPPSPPSRAQAFRPWIGSRYGETHLLVVGENLHDHGGWDQAEWLVNWSIPKLKEGRKRMNFDNTDYRGSIFQHRAALYASTWLEALGYGVIPVGDAYDYVAFTEAVKCSPRPTPRARSTPNDAMKAVCPAHLLAPEVEILGAKRILVLGTSWNAGAVRAHVWRGLAQVALCGKVSLWRDTVGHEALFVPHPSSWGGARRGIVDDVRAAAAAPEGEHRRNNAEE